MDKKQQPVAKAAVAEAASHVHSKKKTASEELLYDDTQDEDKVDYAELQRRKQGEINLVFAQRAMSALDKIGARTNEASVLNLVMPSVFSEQDNTASMSRKIRLRELGDLLKKIINSLTECNRVVICLKETQYMDSLSWELLWEVLLHCPKLSVFIFSRKLHDYESESNRNVVTKIKGLPTASFMTIEGLNLEETRQLILACWVGPKIKEVDDSIIVEIHKRSDGKPLYIRSLALSLKETGQFRVLEDGTLTGLGKLDIGFSFDDRNIVISQFDRLNRTFQLFLKIAAVVGQVFLLEDVVYFLTGMPGMFEKIETTNLNELVAGVEGMDTYKYLQRRDDAVGFTFKSTVVRQFVYSLMVLQQREVLHARVAKHFESKLTPENRYHLLIPIYEHYMQAGQKEQAKKIYYLEAIAEFHFENESMSEAVKAYNMLLDCIKSETNVDVENLAGWHRELGAAYLHLEDFEKAKGHLLECLRLQDYSLPPNGMKFDWELKKHIATRQKYEKTMLPGPMREDYVKSYKDFMGSGMILTANSKGADDFRQRAPPKINLLKSLFGLAKIFAGMHELKQLKLVLLIALNLCEEMPKDGLYCQLMSLYAVYTFHNEDSASMAPKYIEMAETYDMRYAINESIDVVSASASLAFMLGNWAECKRKYDALLHLGTLANDYKSTSQALRYKCILFLFGNSRPSSIGLARELFNLATEQDDWEGQFWGSFLLITNLLSLSEPEDVIELQRIITRHEALWSVATDAKKSDPIYLISRSALLAHVAVSRDKRANVSSILNNVASQFERLFAEQQELAFVACLHLHHTFVMLQINNSIVTDKATTAIFNDICEAIHKMTKAGLHTSSLSADMKHLFKGIKAQVTKKTGDAQKAWITGALTEGKTDAIYIQGLFNACLAKFHDKKAESDKALAQARGLLSKVGAVNELRKIWNF
jgi:tetratricopeptide (TPR) repeat protein